MKKVLLGVFALILTLGLVSCKNEKPAEPTDEAPAAVEQVFSLENVQKIVDKVKAESANWSVDEWKAVFKEMLTAVAPKLIELDALTSQMEDPAKIQEVMGKLEDLKKEYAPVEALMNAFEEAAAAAPNGKAVLDDLEFAKQIKKELGIKVEDEEPEAAE